MARVEPYGINLILTGDIREIAPKMETGSVNCIVCSPPYFGLRDYGVEGQIGLEKTPQEYVETLVGIFREIRRVLRDDGTVWLNLGDSYAGSGGHYPDAPSSQPEAVKARGGFGVFDGRLIKGNNYTGNGLKPKDLIGIPWRVALALQADGWYLRSDIIWAKKNPMPESVRDRPTKAHEYIFLLSKKARYYYDQEAVREPFADDRMGNPGTNGTRQYAPGDRQDVGRPMAWDKGAELGGRNRRTVWTCATKPYPQAHFATFPPDLIRPCILAGCPAKVCADCGAPWVRMVEKDKYNRKGDNIYGNGTIPNYHNPNGKVPGSNTRGMPDPNTRTTGFKPTCTCNAPTAPGVVLDPFMGSGTVAQVAIEEGRNWIGVELNPDYVKLAVERILNAKPKPPYEQTEIAYG